MPSHPSVFMFALALAAGCSGAASTPGTSVPGDASLGDRAPPPSDAAVLDAPAPDASPVTPPANSWRGVPITDYDHTQVNADAIGYDVDLRADVATARAETYEATCTGTFVAVRALDALTLDFAGNTIEAAEVDGAAATYERAGDQLTVHLGRTVPPGGAFAVRVRYHGDFLTVDRLNIANLSTTGGLMARPRNRAGRRIFLSLDWPSHTRTWLPVRDLPRDGAMVAIRATFPQAYAVLANGRRLATADGSDGSRTWQYESRTPMPPYAFHLGAYDDWVQPDAQTAASGTTVRHVDYSGDTTAAATAYADLAAAMDYYEGTFGPYRWEPLTFIEEPIYPGGMEHATVVSMDDSLYSSPAATRAVWIHEMAHHWAGDLVRIDGWNDFWMSEGFADYLMRRFVEAHDGAAAGTDLWRTTLRQALSQEGASATAPLHPVRPPDPAGDPVRLLDAITYKKGAWMLRMLEHRLGTPAFSDFLRGWFERHRGDHVTTATFQRELEAAAGGPLEDFFAAFVRDVYHPVLDVTFHRDAATGAAAVSVDQVQTRGPADGFAFRVDLDVTDGTRHQRATLDLRGRHSATQVAVDFVPTRVVADPDGWMYGLVTCDAGRPCRDGWTCGPLGSETVSVCSP